MDEASAPAKADEEAAKSNNTNAPHHSTQTIEQLRDDYDNLQAAHVALLSRIQQDGDTRGDNENDEMQVELKSLRDRIKELELSLSTVTAERDELSSTVRDLRVRVEESRRAIMRLQGQGGTTSNKDASSTSANDGLGASLYGNQPLSAAQKADARRSVGPAILASWNPREMGVGGLGVTAASPSPDSEDHDSSSMQATAEELAERKRSKRATMAFGPLAGQGGVVRRMHGHRRIASGSRIGTDDSTDSQVMPPPAVSGGLRELHLGGATIAAPPSASTSKRTSMIGGSFFRSPAPSEAADVQWATTPGEESPEKNTGLAATVGSLLMPSRSVRRISNSSSVSGGIPSREEAEPVMSLAPPSRSTSRLSNSPSQVSITSPISEGGAEGELDEPVTARASYFGMSPNSGAGANSLQLQRSLMESKVRLRDRDEQLAQMKRELHVMRLQLDEEKDARAASEACLTALREFVKQEGGQGEGDEADGARMDALKGVKLPPLPTDKSTDDMDGSRDDLAQQRSPATPAAPSAWRSFGSTLAGLSNRKGTESGVVTESGGAAPATKMLPATPDAAGGFTTQQHLQHMQTPVSPATQITSSFNNLWSRAAGTRESLSAQGEPDVAGSSPGESAAQAVQYGGGQSSDSAITNSPSAAFKGFGWFAKRTVSNASDAASSTNTSGAPSAAEPPTPTTANGVRVSSPPFANLDNHVLTLDQIAPPPVAARKTSSSARSGGGGGGGGGDGHKATSSAGSSGGGGGSGELEPNARARKAKEKSEGVDEDTGFVPPAF